MPTSRHSASVSGRVTMMLLVAAARARVEALGRVTVGRHDDPAGAHGPGRRDEQVVAALAPPPHDR